MTNTATLNTRATTFVTLHTPVSERNIAPFPSSSIIVKATWRTVGPDDTESFEVWDPPDPKRSDCQSGCPRTIQVRLAKRNEPCNKPKNQNESYFSSCFYTVQDPNVTEYKLLLFGLHVITKETADWTWSTFWWQADPDVGTFHEGRPDAQFKRDYWKHYVMDSTLSMTTPPEATPCEAPAQNIPPPTLPTADIFDCQNLLQPVYRDDAAERTNLKLHVMSQDGYVSRSHSGSSRHWTAWFSRLERCLF